MKPVRELVNACFSARRYPKATLIYEAADALDAELARLRELERHAYGYLGRVFLAINPQCQLLPDLMGLCTQIDNSMTEITKLRELVEWQPISEAPKDGSEVIGYLPDYFDDEVITVIEYNGGWLANWGEYVHPTYFRPLGDLPKVQ